MRRSVLGITTKNYYDSIFIYPDFKKECILITDASATAVGAILEQNGKVVQYASKPSLLETQKRMECNRL